MNKYQTPPAKDGNNRPPAELSWIARARGYLGLTEIPGAKHNPVVVSLWQIAFTAIGRKATASVWQNDETPWCAGFVAAVLAESSLAWRIPVNFPMARSWLSAGVRLPAPAYGCIAVFWRNSPKSGAGHVGFVVGQNSAGQLLILGGNQNNTVSIKPFSKQRLLGLRWCGRTNQPAFVRYKLPIINNRAKLSVNEA